MTRGPARWCSGLRCGCRPRSRSRCSCCCPRLVSAAWGALALFLLLLQFGAGLRLSQRLLDLSPFTHIPKVPGGDLSLTPLISLGAITAALTIAGLIGLSRRDIGLQPHPALQPHKALQPHLALETTPVSPGVHPRRDHAVMRWMRPAVREQLHDHGWGEETPRGLS
ncbi:hypothetical protein [Actinomadura sp. HBU206391]|uniref:hypothetical protein n=1 Tax=Actinomadura sp. HBU206391 TaxID=2731692 RepID=UPI00164FED6A|nr:hypothetical protein [Actinomadura sp. HBU206391]MBC6459812.1 hypothetical protein [Actinomadura sp. HBU206391]